MSDGTGGADAEPLRIGVVGAGWAAGMHLEAYARVPGVRLAAIASRTRSRAELLAERHRVERVVASPAELAAAVDAVSVATPPASHPQLVRAALAAGRHVLCDKPLAVSAEAARDLARQARAAGVRHAVGFIWRGDPALIHLRDLLRAGEIGQVREIRSTSLLAAPVLPMNWMYEAGTGGGTLAQHGSHVFDWARWLIGADIAEVHGTLAHDVRGALDTGHVHDLGEALGGALPEEGEGRFRPVLTDSGYDVRARFTNDVRGAFWEAWHQAGPHDDHILVHGEKGALEWRGSGGLTLYRIGTEPLVLPLPGAAASGRAAGMARWRDLALRFIGGIRKGTSRPDHATFDDGWQAAAVVDAVRRSDASGRWEKVV